MGTGGNPNRQRMINLMYIVFIAMMALNVPPEVLDGFAKVEGELRQATEASHQQNTRLASDMQVAFDSNPTKVTPYYTYSQELQQRTDSLYLHIQRLKESIAIEADGKGASPAQLVHRDNLSAATSLLLSSSHPEGKELRKHLNSYAHWVSTLLKDSPSKQKMLERLSTPSGQEGKSWEEACFENMPAIAAITQLTQLQNSLRYIEGESLSELLRSIGASDYRANKLTAQVIPDSRIVLRGIPYQANIVLSSIDTTKHPKIFVQGGELAPSAGGRISLATSSIGTFPIKGHIEAELNDGTIVRSPFESSYTVIEPTATIAPTMMNVLYAGIDNPIQIAVPGVPLQDLTASISAGSLTRKGDVWVAHPTKAGGEVTISVVANMGGGNPLSVAQKKLRVRFLPDPTPYLNIPLGGGSSTRFKGGRITKSSLLASGGVRAALDDSFLDISYSVLRFQLLAFDALGNALPESTQGAHFSDRQIRLIQNTPHGRRLFITDIIARGPDGIERRLPSLELIIA